MSIGSLLANFLMQGSVLGVSPLERASSSASIGVAQ